MVRTAEAVEVPAGLGMVGMGLGAMVEEAAECSGTTRPSISREARRPQEGPLVVASEVVEEVAEPRLAPLQVGVEAEGGLEEGVGTGSLTEREVPVVDHM